MEIVMEATNEMIGWAKEDVAEGNPNRAIKRLKRMIESARVELADNRDPLSTPALEAGNAALEAYLAVVEGLVVSRQP